MAEHKQIVICGAGIAGISTAYSLAVEHDLKNVLLVDERSKLAIQLDACSYWEAYTEANAAHYMETGMAGIPGHSAEFETCVALAAFPDRVHREVVDYSKVRLNLKSADDANQDRKYYEESLLATAEEGEALNRIAVDWTANKVRRMISQS